MLRSWWRARRRRQRAVELGAEAWIARHGRFALPLARMRAIDAYLLGDLTEQEHWSRIRETIEAGEQVRKGG